MTNEQKINETIRRANELTDAQIDEYRATPDKLIWIEVNILSEFCSDSVCTNVGEILAEAAELVIDKRIEKARY